MNVWQIILATIIFLAGCAQQLALAAPPYPTTSPYPTTAAPVDVNSAPYLQTSPVFIQPSLPAAPLYPPQSTVVPLPSQTRGSIFGPQVGQPGVAPSLPPGAVGPEQLPLPPGVGPQVPGMPVEVGVPGPANPISVPVVDDDLAWDQISDVVSDYFRIAREQRARRGGEVWTEGRIETAPLDGATWLEPHRADSVGEFNRWESTFQSIRRRATVRVIPDANGYLVELIVEKELEDLPKPEKSTAGTATFRNDGSLPSRRLEEVSRTHPSPRWIPLGRDPALEQRMLAEIHARLNGITVGHRSVFGQ